MGNARITIVGGGVYVVGLSELIAKRLPGEVEIELVARRFERLRVIAEHTRLRLSRIGADCCVRAWPSLAEGVSGADIVVLLPRVGNLPARARDESFPAQFGIQGDEGIGPGGIANYLRTAPVMSEIARSIQMYASGAVVLNMTAPLGLTTRQLIEAGLNAIGVCELPAVTLAKLLDDGPAATLPQGLRYGGLNHLGWFWPMSPRGEALLATAADRGVVDAETYCRFQATPLRYYFELFDQPAAGRLGVVRRAGRAQQLMALTERVFQHFAATPGEEVAELAERPTPWFDHALVPILRAILAGDRYCGFANVANHGLIDGLPAELVVELPVLIEGRGIHPATVGAPPAPAAAFLSAVAESEMLTYRAVTQRDTRLILTALAALPLSLPESQLPDLAEATLAAGDYPSDRGYRRDWLSQ
jgi:6-phospho-beta-glucosidase